MTEDAWWVKINGEIVGPRKSAELRQLTRNGKLQPQSLVSRDQEQWVEAGRMRALFPPPAPPGPGEKPQGALAKPFQVFISYSAKDKTWAERACAYIEQQRVRCWIAPRDIVPGTEWSKAIVDEIDGSQLMLLIFSRNANDSPQVRREVERAVSKGVPVIPFRIEDVSTAGVLEYTLRHSHWRDGFTKPVENQYAKLVRSIQALQVKCQANNELETSTEIIACESTDRSVDSMSSLDSVKREPWLWGLFIRSIQSLQRKRKANSDLKTPPHITASASATRKSRPRILEVRDLAERFSREEIVVNAPRITALEVVNAQLNSEKVTRSLATNADASIVDCTIFAPTSVWQGEPFIVQVFAHTPEFDRQAAEFAREFDASTSRRGFKCLESHVNIGSTLTFHLTIPSLEVVESVRMLTWKGRTEAVQFDVRVPQIRNPGSANETLLISLDNVPVGQITFRVAISINAAEQTQPLLVLKQA